MATLERLKQQLLHPNRKIGVLIDNLEPAPDGNGKFISTGGNSETTPWTKKGRVVHNGASQQL